MFSYFSIEQILPLIPACILLSVSILFNTFQKEKISLLLLFLGTLCLGIFISLLDPFLILWDEQFHALVAKNMIQHPFEPMLYANPVIDYDFRNWNSNHIWLHKPPLFLWQMALSMKVFGINIVGVRFASVLLHAIIPLFIYRIGKISQNKDAGFYGALFFGVAYFPLELVAGRFSTDHNDVAFMLYIAASFWAFFEYLNSEKWKWIILIGVFAGCAVMVKWLTGLLVFAGWFIVILFDKSKRNNLHSFVKLLISIICSIIIFIPWQMYIMNAFPKESQYELALNAKHFFLPVEGHNGTWWYHLDAVRTLYGRGTLIPIILLLASVYYCIKVKVKNFRIFYISVITIVYLWFSIVATKMVSYCIIVSPLVFLAIGSLTNRIIEILMRNLNKWRNLSYLFSFSILFGICILLLNLPRIANYHTSWKPKDNFNREQSLIQMEKLRKLSLEIPDSTYIIFNCDKFFNVPVMFFTGYTVYDFLPSEKQIENLQNEGYKIALMNVESLPSYIKGKNILIIK